VWWVLLGLFISAMAGAEEAQARTGAALEGLRVRDVMTADPDTADGDTTVTRFLQETALVRRHSTFPLTDGLGRPTGLVTLGRLKAVPAADREHLTLAQIACPVDEIPFARPDEPLTELLPRMHGCSDGRALVLDGERLAGIVSPSDISRAVTWRGIGLDGPASRV
jgi:CBS domain-containing protein